jgi:hypothetical protein
MIDADRAGLVCGACGTTTWLPSASGARSGDVIDVDVKPAPQPTAMVSRPPTVPQIAPAAAASTALTTSGSAWTQEERARVDERLAKVPGSPDARDGFVKLLASWSNEAEHKLYLKKVALAGDLAQAGQMYRAVLDALPLDPFAKKAQGEILTLAMATMSAKRDISSPEKGPGRNMAILVVGGLLLLVALAVGAKVLHNLVGGDRIDDASTKE